MTATDPPTTEVRRLRCALFVDFDNVYLGLQRLDRKAAEAFATDPGHWLAEPGRLSDPVLLRHALWCGVDTGLPVQLHTGFGDPDEDLHRANPALLAGFCRATRAGGTPIVLLHCYPYHREAGWLA